MKSTQQETGLKNAIKAIDGFPEIWIAFYDLEFAVKIAADSIEMGIVDPEQPNYFVMGSVVTVIPPCKPWVFSSSDMIMEPSISHSSTGHFGLNDTASVFRVLFCAFILQNWKEFMKKSAFYLNEHREELEKRVFKK